MNTTQTKIYIPLTSSHLPLEESTFEVTQITYLDNEIKQTIVVSSNDLSKVNEEEIESKIEEIIWSNNKDSNKETLESIKKFGQLVVGVVLQDGTVLDGNRRFTALRKLSREKSNQDNNQ